MALRTKMLRWLFEMHQTALAAAANATFFRAGKSSMHLK